MQALGVPPLFQLTEYLSNLRVLRNPRTPCGYTEAYFGVTATMHTHVLEHTGTETHKAHPGSKAHVLNGPHIGPFLGIEGIQALTGRTFDLISHQPKRLH